LSKGFGFDILYVLRPPVLLLWEVGVIELGAGRREIEMRNGKLWSEMMSDTRAQLALLALDAV